MQAYPCLRRFGRACLGEERDEPKETKSQPTGAASHGESFPNHLQLGGPPLLFVWDSCAPYLFSCSILAFPSSVSASSQLLCPEAIPQVGTSIPYLTVCWIWKGFVIIPLILALNPTPGESGDLTHPFEKGLASSCISPASGAIHSPSVWRAVGNLLRREGFILLFQGKFRNKRTCTVWFPAILKQSSVWLLFLATGQFPTLGSGSEAPSVLWLTVIPPFNRACTPACLGLVFGLVLLCWRHCYFTSVCFGLLLHVSTGMCPEPPQHHGQKNK